MKKVRNPYKEWKRYHLDECEYTTSFLEAHFYTDKPKTVGFDTETTGLHIKKDKVFLVVFGWLMPGKDYGRVFTFYPTKENMKVFFRLANKAKYCVAHNTKYDLHMLSNTGYAEEVQAMTNLCEGMVVARLSLEAIPTRDGGDSLALKDLGVKYVHHEANKSEHMIKDELKRIRDEQIKELTAALKQFDHPTETEYKPFRLDTGKKTTTTYAKANPSNVEWKTVPKKWGKGLVEDFLKDITNDIEDLPKDVREVWEIWNEENPKPTYEDVDRELMIKYAGEDVITMLEFFKKAYITLKERDQLKILDHENECILPLYRMERVGLKADRKYLEESRVKVKNYIKKQRTELCKIAGEIVTVGQHERIKQIYNEKWNIQLESADKKTMKDIVNNFDGEPKRFAELIKSLRTLEKWYSTYIVRILDISSYDGKAYTQIHQASAVSGRVGSDFQQFPKKNLKDDEGNELYHPRKAFVCPEGYEWYFLDFSQIELRTQANYTLLVSGGDTNLCRAYMPFKCHRKEVSFIIGLGETETVVQYDYNDPIKRKDWDKYDWYLNENPSEKWVPVDVHGATTQKAYPELDPSSDEFKIMRGNGKMVNFLKNYGGSLKAITAQLDGVTLETAKRLDEGYYKAFPGVGLYQEGIIRAHRNKGYVSNMYSRRYYVKDTNLAYKLGNYCVQGTDADLLKKCIVAIDKFLLDKKSKFIMNIHDELQFLVIDEEKWIVPKLKEIMETHDWHLVPIVADIEVTKTNWYEKQEVV